MIRLKHKLVGNDISKERALTLIISAAQGFYIIHSYINKHAIKDSNMLILLLVLITGTLLMVWLEIKIQRMAFRDLCQLF